MTDLILGIDLGTSGIKAGIIDDKGNILRSAYWDAEREAADVGRMEQNPEDYYAKTLGIINKVVAESESDPARIACIAIDGQMGGIIGIDDAFSSITGLDMGLDIRSETYNHRMHEGSADRLAAVTCGSPRNTPKIMRWKREQRDVYDRVVKFVTLSGYVTGKMAGLKGGDAFLDYTLLSFFGNEDAANLTWSPELTGLFELDVEKLPRIVKPWDIVGGLTREAAKAAGLLEGTKIIAGAGDQPAGLLGSNFIGADTLVDVSGSTTLLFQTVNGFTPDLKHRAVMYMPAAIEGRYHAFTYINGGGISISWFKDEFLSGEVGGASFDEVTKAAEGVRPGSGGLFFIPYFGGRQCPYDAAFRGGWLGMNWGHKPQHLFRSILECLAYDYNNGLTYMKELFPNSAYKKMNATGGGSKNGLWNAIKADVMGIPYVPFESYENTLKGCALLAGYGVGMFDNLEAAARMFNPPREDVVVKPDMEKHALYGKYFNVFKSMFSQTLEKTFKDIFSING